jgi:hypothetical protein
MAQRSHQPFHFQPLENRELTETDNAPLLFTSRPPGRHDGVTLFFRTRKTLRQRLGVYDPGELDSVLSGPSCEGEREQMRRALGRASNFHYIFPDNRDEDEGLPSFSALLARTLAS